MDAPEVLFRNIAATNDPKDFEKLFHLFYTGLCVYAKQFVENETVCEDIVQDVFVNLWEDRKKIRIQKKVSVYLMISVKNQCMNYLRREGVTREYNQALLLNRKQPEEDTYHLSELYFLYQRSLSALPETYRLVFEMYRMEGKDYQEIADTLGISVRSAKRYRSYVTEVLKKDLKDYLPLLILISDHIVIH